MKQLLASLLCLLLLTSTMGCGNKGPLELSDEEEEKTERATY
jgi:predicted small lipoprotein YifL